MRWCRGRCRCVQASPVEAPGQFFQATDLVQRVDDVGGRRIGPPRVAPTCGCVGSGCVWAVAVAVVVPRPVAHLYGECRLQYRTARLLAFLVTLGVELHHGERELGHCASAHHRICVTVWRPCHCCVTTHCVAVPSWPPTPSARVVWFGCFLLWPWSCVSDRARD